MSELAHRRPQSVAEHATVDYAAALRYLGLPRTTPSACAGVGVRRATASTPYWATSASTDEKPYVHLAGYLHIANADPHFEGIESVREWDDDRYYHATVRVHRSDRIFPSERSGEVAETDKPKSGGGTYADEDADAKAFAQAARRALRMAFNVDHPDPAEDHGEVPAPPPVVEVARIVQEKSGAVTSASGAYPGMVRRHRAVPRPGPPVRPAAPPPRGAGGSDPTSPPRPLGEGGGSGTKRPGWVSAAETRDNVRPTRAMTPPRTPRPSSTQEAKVTRSNPTTNAGRPAVRGDQSTEGNAAGGKGKSDDSAGPSPVQDWCELHGHDIRHAQIHLRKVHGDEFGDITSITELKGLRGERADRAIAYLDAWLQAEDNTLCRSTPLSTALGSKPPRDGPRRASCFECGAEMLAKTGEVVAWHWAHLTENPHCAAALEGSGILGGRLRRPTKGSRSAQWMASGGLMCSLATDTLSSSEKRTQPRRC